METVLNSIPIKPNKKSFIFAAVFVLLLIIFGVYFLLQKPFGFIGHSYSQIYTLVDDKISQSAAVILTLPKNILKEGAEKLVSFEPPLKGSWLATDVPNALAFKPAEPLTIGKRYTAKLAMAEGALAKDFVIDEDPKVLEVFPRSDSEADEHSSITIVFNRPMVPLTTLSTLEAAKIPIEITPATEGKFKWISTRTLQFIPKDHLAFSAHYAVKILPGFASTDGVPVPTANYTFTTRLLRHENDTDGLIL